MKKIIILCALILNQSAIANHHTSNNMNDLYKSLIVHHKNDKAYIAKVKKAQKKWQEFLNAQIELFYPKEGLGAAQYGCITFYKNSLEKSVTKETKYLSTFEEGDACNISD